MIYGTRLISFLALATVAAGCGSTPMRTASQPAPVATPAVVELELVSPDSGDVTSSSRITVRGTVSPADATVLVQGRPATIRDGIFTGQARLRRGRVTIDVIATADGAAPASASVEVTRRAARRAIDRRPAPAPTTVVVRSAPVTGGGCGAGVSAGPNTSCPFALNVRDAYYASGPGTVYVYSPVTGRTYAMYCSSSAPVVCTGGKNASVYIS